MTTFEIGEKEFLLDGQPFQVLAGAIHYFRIHPDQWRDRIRKAKAMGLNAIETYVPWNAHAPVRGQFQVGGGLDLGRFLDLVAAEGMYAMVRPGPFICAEWDNGGLPVWLTGDPTVTVRSSEPNYLAAVAEYLGQVLPIVATRQVSRGGPVLMVQVENEYGAYGSDKAYLMALVELIRAQGIEMPLFTCDQATDRMLEDGGLPGLHKTATFGSGTVAKLEVLRRHQPTGPLMCAEFWNGWFDHWGAHHHTTPAEASASELDALLAAGASVNVYMFHGGTNFGFTNGANDKGVYQPTTTSYDYDAPLAEDGRPRDKYFAYRDVISKRLGSLEVADDSSDAPAPATVGTVRIAEKVMLADVLDVLGRPVAREVPPTMDSLGLHSGFMMYATTIPRDANGVLAVGEIRDRAVVLLGGRPVGTLSRDSHERVVALHAKAGDRLELLVEDQGRVNYGTRLGEEKGLIGTVTLAGHTLTDWTVHALELGALAGDTVVRLFENAVPVGAEGVSGPVLVRGTFEADQGRDLYLALPGWTKGVAFINGFNLGRYWSRGPQRTLYVPGPLVRHGQNELVVLELHGATAAMVELVPGLELGHTEQ